MPDATTTDTAEPAAERSTAATARRPLIVKVSGQPLAHPVNTVPAGPTRLIVPGSAGPAPEPPSSPGTRAPAALVCKVTV